ncbi:hypothetical protein D030_4247A, partial [Vibrio parahaemolyticus AQ3810]
MVERQEAFY